MKKQRKPDAVPSINNNIQGNDKRGSRRVACSMKIERQCNRTDRWKYKWVMLIVRMLQIGVLW